MSKDKENLVLTTPQFSNKDLILIVTFSPAKTSSLTNYSSHPFNNNKV
jgi:hypothetical protein